MKRLEPRIVLAFAAIYLIWGSTYLAIRFALEALPPFGLSGLRYLIGGGVLFALARLAGNPIPARKEWGPQALLSLLMPIGGTGVVVFAERLVSSGLAAVLIATVPLWVVLLEMTIFDRSRPAAAKSLGVILGMIGMVILIRPVDGVSAIDPFGAFLLIFAAGSWAVGSLLSRRVGRGVVAADAAAMQLLIAGSLLTLASVVTGESWGAVEGGRVGLAVGSLIYLALVGSVVAFRAYLFLLRRVQASAVATYAFINPVVALVLGYFLASETLELRSVLASGTILLAVVLIVSDAWRREHLEHSIRISRVSEDEVPRSEAA